jgi:signal transduction histidine kinase
VDAKKSISVRRITESSVFIHTAAGGLLGYFVLHPVTMFIYWFKINNANITLQSLLDASSEGIIRAFHLNMMPMSLAFAVIGSIAGLAPGLYFRKIRRQEQEINGQQYQLNETLGKLKKLNKSLEEKIVELKKSNNEKDIFFSIIAHDLRSPLNGFWGLTRILVEELPNMTIDQIQQITLSMENSATGLYQLLENLLEWARMQQGLIPFDPKPVEILPEVEESVVMILESAKSKEIEITYDIPNDLAVFADSKMLQFVIRNLVSNAVKFTHKGGKINVSAKAKNNNRVLISIKDSGIGMSSGMVDHLFRLDSQINRNGTEGEPSSGLGLTLCKEFVEKLGGKIELESKEGEGSLFYFTIPHFDRPNEK